jgi:metal-dependent amidase/aminoacylase/carboxypeptidase family protein
VFDAVDAVLAFHATNGPTRVSSAAWAAAGLKVRFHGKAAHAAAAPWEGVNALDAMIAYFVAIGLMRQQLRADSRVHGIITNGGQAFNVIPELTEAVVTARSYDTAYMYELRDRLRTLAEAAALATGCGWEADGSVLIEGVRHVPELGAIVENHLEALGMEWEQAGPFVASTDFGNVSQRVPSVQLEWGVFPAEHALHTRGVAEMGATQHAHECMVRAAHVLALTAADLAAHPDRVAALRRDFRAD